MLLDTSNPKQNLKLQHSVIIKIFYVSGAVPKLQQNG